MALKSKTRRTRIRLAYLKKKIRSRVKNKKTPSRKKIYG